MISIRSEIPAWIRVKHFCVNTEEEFNVESIHLGQSNYMSWIMGAHRHQSSLDGKPRWRFHTDGAVWSSPTIVDGEIYFGSDDGCVYAVDELSGTKLWSHETEGSVRSSPSVVDETLYIGSYDGSLYAIDTANGSCQWEFETKGGIRSSPTISEETLFVGSNDTKIYAIDINSGKKIWDFETGHNIWSSPTVVDQTVFIGSKDDCIYALDTSSGELKWRYQTNGRIEASPTVKEDSVLCANYAGEVISIERGSGERNWQYATKNQIRSSPTSNEQLTFIGSDDGKLHAIDTATGAFEWTAETGAHIHSSPTLVDRTVFVGNHAGKIFAFDSVSGEKRWTCSVGDKISSSPTVADGILYIGDRGTSSLHAIKVKAGSSSGSRVLNKTLGHHTKDRSRVGQGIVEESLKRGQNAVQSANEAHERGNYHTEVTELQEALSEFNNAWNKAKLRENNHEVKDIKTQIENVKNKIKTAKKLRAHNKIDQAIEEANQYISDGNKQFGNQKYSQAEANFKKAKDKLSLAANKAGEFDLDEKENIEEKIDSTRKSIKSCRLAPLNDRLSTGQELISNEKYSEAVRIIEQTIQDIKNLDFDNTDSKETLNNAKASLLDAQLRQNDERIEDAQDQFNSGKYHKAYKEFKDIKAGLEELFEDAASYEMFEKQDEINELIDYCSDIISETRNELYSDVTGTAAPVSDIEVESPQTTTSSSELPGSEIPTTTLQTNSSKAGGNRPEFERIEELGTGGTASVYKVQLEDSGEIAALKKPDFEGTFTNSKLKEFVNEAQTWRKVDSHRNIVSVRDWGKQPVPWLLIEYIENGDLDSAIHDVGLSDGLQIMKGVTDALVHADRICHHDIKPKNILLTEELSPKLADWGLAKITGTSRSRESKIGTVGYRAPEQFNHESLDHRTDMYQLGVTGYEILTGELPFDPQVTDSLEHKVKHAQPTPPSEINSNIPSDVDELILRCLAKDKSDRFNSHASLRESIEDLLDTI